MLHRRHKYDIIVLAAALGLADTIYLTVYKILGTLEIPCSITHGCETVLTSRYSVILGVPLSVWGLIFFSGILVFALLANHYATARKLLTLGLGVGALASVILLGIQFFLIKKVCQYCLLSDVLAVLLFIWDLNIEYMVVQRPPDSQVS